MDEETSASIVAIIGVSRCLSCFAFFDQLERCTKSIVTFGIGRPTGIFTERCWLNLKWPTIFPPLSFSLPRVRFHLVTSLPYSLAQTTTFALTSTVQDGIRFCESLFPLLTRELLDRDSSEEHGRRIR